MKMEVVRVNERPAPLKRHMEVYCRLRGGSKDNSNFCMTPVNETDLVVHKPDNGNQLKYKFKRVFDSEASQKCVFDGVAYQLVQELLSGKSGLLFAYGVTGSGKTFTMAGTNEDPGIMARCLDVLFNTVTPFLANKYIFKPDKMNRFEIQTEADAKLERDRAELRLKARLSEDKDKIMKTKSEEDLSTRSKDTSKAPYLDEDNLYAVFVTYVEVYNNNVYDLLEDLYSDISKPSPLQAKLVREDSTRNMYVHGVTEVEVRGPDEAYEIFYKGQKRKHIAQTNLNSESSRAHTVFTIRLVQAPLDESGEKLVQDKSLITVSQLSLVDLAGSERTLRTNNSGQRLREAGNINNSLMTLRTCLEYLRDNQNGGNKMIPYRESRLTHLFKNYFDGEGQVSMIICVNPSSNNLDETLHVLKFAEMSQEIQLAHAYQRPLTLFTPGRRKHQAKLIDYDVIVNDPPLDKFTDKTSTNSWNECSAQTPLDFFRNLPMIGFVESDDNTSLMNSVSYWTDSLESWNNLTNAMNKRSIDAKEKFSKCEREYCLLHQELKSLKELYEGEKKKTLELDGRLRNLTTENGNLKRKLNDLELREKRLKRELSDKNIELERIKIEGNISKEKMLCKIQEVESKLNHEFEKKLDKQKSKITNELRKKDKKLKEVRRIVSDNTLGCKTPSILSLKSSSEEEPIDSSKQAQSSQPMSEPPQCSSGCLTPANTHLDSTPKARTTIRKMGIPTANRRHRRSKSADVWLDHRPAIAVPLGTVLQPVMEKRRSITKLTQARDITAKTSKYCLMTQTQDEEGDLETRLYKADVIPTSGGGAQVTFNDIEVLKQISPTQSPMKKS